MKIGLLFMLMIFVSSSYSHAKEYKVSSPDGRLILTIDAGPGISWKASYDGKEIISSVKLGMVLADGKTLGENEKVKRAETGKIDNLLEPVVTAKHSVIRDQCNTLLISFRSGFAVQFRAYNDGAGYRFETSLKDDLTVREEIFSLAMPAGTHSWYPLEESFMSHNERSYIYSSLDTIATRHLASLPTLFNSNGINIILTEADIEDYPGMWIRGDGKGKLKGVHPGYPDSEKLEGDRNLFVSSTKDYIASTRGTRSFPWRVFVVAPTDGQLVESELVFKLAAPQRLTDTKWIKPGQVAWDWWNANNVYGVDFRAGINNETYKYYIDFAAKNGIEYIILDEGWYRIGGSVLEPVPEIDVSELCRYGAAKNVGVILWVVFKTLWDDIDEAFALYEKWGVKGVKVDFMQRDDQKMVNFYYEATRKAAEHHMLIDFHGAYKPDGLGRTYPNALTREGVKGMENNKWSKDITPEHDVILPFTRMVAGPMDYTPGAMINMEKVNYNPQFTRPTSQGTRVHQMALYIVFESPLQMLSDSPSNYMKEQECTDFIAGVPVVWDDIKVIDGKVGDYILLARRSGREWFVGGLTDWESRQMELDLSFLPAGDYSIDIFQDGINADNHAQDYKHIKNNIKSGDKMNVKMAPGGGWVARISPK
ncbi:MAG: glycoside hydrolase family 97 protein [Bacteroidales bacterium]|nr:glycoside hydrolase family 97 protein [Bacteroidales bacterium]